MTAYRALRVNAERLLADFHELCEIGATIHGGISRLALSNEDLRARAWLDRRFQEAGLEVRDDDAGNLSGLLPAASPDAKTLLLGSHLDTVPDGGCYDGTIGVLAALESLRVIKESGITLPVHLEAIDFTDEEGCWHPHLGSRALTGALNANYASDAERDYGPFRAALFRAGIPPANIYKARRDPAALAGYLELHIEQSDRLFKASNVIGVVTNIAGRAIYEMTVNGEPCHSGTTSMDKRQDALLGVATHIVEAHRVVRQTFPEGMFTCGHLMTSAGTFNMIPQRAKVIWDCRHVDREKMTQMEECLVNLAHDMARDHLLEVETKCVVRTPAATMAGRAVLAIERACAELSLPSMRLTSYSGHDAQIMSEFTPSGMIFVPSVGGISHCPREFTEWQHVIDGANVLLQTALHLAHEVGQ